MSSTTSVSDLSNALINVGVCWLLVGVACSLSKEDTFFRDDWEATDGVTCPLATCNFPQFHNIVSSEVIIESQKKNIVQKVIHSLVQTYNGSISMFWGLLRRFFSRRRCMFLHIIHRRFKKSMWLFGNNIFLNMFRIIDSCYLLLWISISIDCAIFFDLICSNKVSCLYISTQQVVGNCKSKTQRSQLLEKTTVWRIEYTPKTATMAIKQKKNKTKKSCLKVFQALML